VRHKREQRYILTETDDGKWRGHVPQMRTSSVIADNPADVIDGLKVGLAAFTEFCAHFDKECLPNCSYCLKYPHEADDAG